MGQKIDYIIKGQPTTVKKVSSAVIAISVGLIIIVDFLYTPLKSLPLELQVFAIGELIPRIFFDFNAIAFLLLFAGFVLYYFRWRKGTIDITDKQIVINGLIGASILTEKVKEISFFHSKYFGHKRMIQIITSDSVFKVKFKNQDSFEDFSQKLVVAAGQFEGVKIDTSFVTDYENDH